MTDTLRAELTTLTSDLVRFASTADRPDQIKASLDYVAAYASKVPGVFVERVEHNGVHSVVVTLRDTHTPAIFLNGHLDVVAAKPEQFEPEERMGRLYGRATQDMKGSVAVMLRLIKDLAAAASINDRPNVGFQFVGDEEIGGFDGTGWLLEQGWRCGFFIAAEPTDMRICYAQKGVAWYEVRLPGVPAHGSRPWDGTNPLLALGHGLVALDTAYPVPEPGAWRTTIVPTIVHSSSASANQIPPEVMLSIDVRHIPEDTPDSITAALQHCFPTGEVRRGHDGPPLDTDPNNPHVQQLANVSAAVLGQSTELYREHFASDARFYSSVGIPAICFGPVGKGLHSDDEWVDLESLAQVYDVLRKFVAE